MNFTLTEALKNYAVANLGVAAGASEADIRKAVGLSLVKGKLSATKLKELASGEPIKKVAPTKTTKAASVAIDPEALNKAVADAVEKALQSQTNTKAAGVTPEAVFAKSQNPVQIRIKSSAERYSSTTVKAFYPDTIQRGDTIEKHALAGRQAEFCHQPLSHPSDLAKAVSGAFYKWCISKSAQPGEIPHGMQLTDHDVDLVNYAARNMEWTGIIKGRGLEHKVHRSKLSEMQFKSILDDTISGGIEAAPVVFDDAIILFPVLYGELFPYVNVVNVEQGRRVKGASMQNPTMTSGIAEGTAIEPFNTSAFVAAFDTTIFPSVGSVLLGLDFEEDTPVGFGAKITEQWGYVVQNELDRYIAVGDGVVEPQGIFNAVGTQSVASQNGAGGRVTITDLEELMFAVAKQYRNEANKVLAYVSNDTMYRRIRKIPVGPGDERRIQGMDYSSYMSLEQPHKINNSIDNGKIAYGNLRRYRMYRRLGMTVRVVTEGLQLAQTNQRAIIVRMRFGGQLETGNAFSVMTDAWS